MEPYNLVEPVHVAVRHQPLGYVCKRDGHASPLFVVGHYETPCGGADPLRSPDEVYQLVRDPAADGADVIFEGIISQDAVPRCVALAQPSAVRVLALAVPLQQPLAG